MERDIFETMPVQKAYIKLALPVVLAMVLTFVYNVVDTFFISLAQDTNLVAGVSVCAPIFILLVAIGDIWGLGGTSLMSRLLGEGKDEEAGRVSAFCLYAAFLTGVIFMMILLGFKAPILYLLGANEDSFYHASSYLSYIALGTPFIILYMVPNNQLRAEGLSNYGMWGAIAGSVANMILDPIFIFGLKMGAAGAAIATSLSNLLSCVIYVLIIIKKCRILTIDLKKANITAIMLWEIVRIGIPAAVTNIMNSLSMALTNRALNNYGNTEIAAMGIALKVNMVCMMVLLGFAFGAQPLFGYTYGNKNVKRFKKSLRFAYIFEACLGAGFAVILCLAAPIVLGLFLKDLMVIAAGVHMLRLMQISSVIVGFALVTTAVSQAVGNAKGALILSLSRQGILFVIAIALLPKLIGFDGILLSQPVADMLTDGISIMVIAVILRGMRQ